MEVQMDDLNGTVETSAGGESNNIEVGPCQEPYEGMLFESEEAAKVFYDDYARRVGFVTRVLSSRKSERDGSIISRGLGCRGVSENRRKVMQKECGEGEVCPAMVLLKQEMPGRWVIKKFLGDHNHLLVIQSPKIRKTLDEKDKKIQELSAELRVKKRLSAAYRDQLLAFIKDIEDHNAHLSTKVQSVSNKLKELEAKTGALTR
ncbi:protein FAR1-RELATED SEQUENCE 5-like [Malus sylvestris]|uniref:protein FAR1-RELATED SEQUENCE 5-like n=1 Tax=Malus sylvestris TaxID=3752 RepID=UPI0021ACDD8F|nr:protein FAR1-RELATED SEQUENCE 5-like [Malus sylvestris]